MKDIVVIGSSNTDMIVQTPHLPAAGETILGGRFSTAAGGKGANQAVAAARAGGRVRLVARLGRDMFGDRALDGFRAEGLDVTAVIQDPEAPSGVALILVDDRGENCIAVASGANARLSPADVARAGAGIDAAGLILMQLETPLDTVSAAAERARAAGAAVILNPAPARDLPDALLAQVTVLTPNETEAEHLTGRPVRNADEAGGAAAALADRGVETVIVTLGAAGVVVHAPDLRAVLPGFTVEAVDTTAAGDTFNGALAVALTEDRPLPEALRFAQAAAALSVTRLGAQPSAPTRSAIEAFLRTH